MKFNTKTQFARRILRKIMEIFPDDNNYFSSYCSKLKLLTCKYLLFPCSSSTSRTEWKKSEFNNCECWGEWIAVHSLNEQIICGLTPGNKPRIIPRKGMVSCRFWGSCRGGIIGGIMSVQGNLKSFFLRMLHGKGYLLTFHWNNEKNLYSALSVAGEYSRKRKFSEGGLTIEELFTPLGIIRGIYDKYVLAQI